jgi:hypothetical protein
MQSLVGFRGKADIRRGNVRPRIDTKSLFMAASLNLTE